MSLTDADNYKWSSVDSADCTLSFEITKNTTNKVTVSIEGWTYGEAVNAPSSTADFGVQNVVYSYSNKENGTYTADVPATVGTWWVKATVPETADYAGSMACTSFSINTRPLTITTGSAEKVYDGTPLTKDGYKISETGLAIGDEILEGSIKVTGSQTEAGSSDNTASGAVIKNGNDDVTANYEITYEYGTLKVTKNNATNNVTVFITGWTYGDNANAPTCTADFGADTVAYTYSNAEDGTYTATVPTNAGTYWVKAGIAGTDNYLAGEAKKSFVIAKKSVSITGLSASDKTYDGTTDAVVIGTATVSGIVGTDDVSFVSGTASFADKNVGTGKAVTFSGFSLTGSAANNYILSAQPAGTTANITAKAVTVKAEDKTKVYGETDPAKTVTIDGLVDGDNESLIAYTISRVTGENAGTYTITPTGDATQGNYTVSFETGTLTISQAQSIANAPAATMFVKYAEGSVVYDKVSKVALPDGWAWSADDKDKALEVNTPLQVSAVYEGADKDNYIDAAKSVTVTITRSACTHESCETEVKDAKAATCTEAGYTGDTYCKTCGEKTSTGSVIPVIAHTYDKEVATEAYLSSAADCTHKAVYFKSCQCGAKGTETFEYGNALGHDYQVVADSALAATCTEAGHEADQECSRCHDVIPGAVINATGHTFDKEVATTAYLKSAADCTHKAVYYKSCVCGEKGTDTFEYGDALGHDYQVVEGTAVAVTMDKDGKEADKECSRCHDYIEGAVIPKHEHVEETINAVAPTCTEAGHTEGKKCSICGTILVAPVEIAATGHTFDKEVVSEAYLKSAADCTHKAVYYKSCQCGEKGTETFEYGDVLGHDYHVVAGSAKAATCTEAGHKENQECSRCHDVIPGAVISATGHNMTKHSAVAATETAEGNSEYWSCDNCGKYFADAAGTVEIPVGSWVIAKLEPVNNQGNTDNQNETGNQGQTGNQGETGNQGDTSNQGQTGNQNETGNQGDTGNQGQTGNQGDTGNQTQPGNQGQTDDSSVQPVPSPSTSENIPAGGNANGGSNENSTVISGGDSVNGNVNNGTVTGATTDAGTAQGNTANVSGGVVTGNITGNGNANADAGKTEPDKTTVDVTTGTGKTTVDDKPGSDKTETGKTTADDKADSGKVDSITDSGIDEIKDSVKFNKDGSITVTKVVDNTDGTKKATTTTKNPDGSSTETVIATKENGYTSTETVLNKNGEIDKTVTKDITKDGNQIIELVTMQNTDEILNSKIVTNVLGIRNVTTTTERDDGSKLTLTAKTAKNGTTLVKAVEKLKDGTKQTSQFKNTSKSLSIDDMKLVLTKVKSNGSIVELPSKFTDGDRTYTVTEIASEAFSGNKTIEMIILSSTIEMVDNNAFVGASKLNTIVVDDDRAWLLESSLKSMKKVKVKKKNEVKQREVYNKVIEMVNEILKNYTLNLAKFSLPDHQ